MPFPLQRKAYEAQLLILLELDTVLATDLGNLNDVLLVFLLLSDLVEEVVLFHLFAVDLILVHFLVIALLLFLNLSCRVTNLKLLLLLHQVVLTEAFHDMFVIESNLAVKGRSRLLYLNVSVVGAVRWWVVQK